MSRAGGRRLSPQEAESWARLASTVTPLKRLRTIDAITPLQLAGGVGGGQGRLAPSCPQPPTPGPSRKREGNHAAPSIRHHQTLDAGWDRKLARGQIAPDFTLDLHGCTLDAAHGRLLHGVTQAKTMGARLVLLVTGRPRPVDPADRSARRGAIRAKAVDWLAASEHAADIAAIRGAHPRHGGQGALYIILKRWR